MGRGNLSTVLQLEPIAVSRCRVTAANFGPPPPTPPNALDFAILSVLLGHKREKAPKPGAFSKSALSQVNTIGDKKIIYLTFTPDEFF